MSKVIYKFPIKLSFLEGYKRGKRAARIQILIVTLGLAALFMGYQVAQAADSVDQGYESTQIDEDGPDHSDTWVSEDDESFEPDQEYSECDQTYCEEGSGCDC